MRSPYMYSERPLHTAVNEYFQHNKCMASYDSEPFASSLRLHALEPASTLTGTINWKVQQFLKHPILSKRLK